ncbi:MAG TPA: proton-conducting transporter membrane subunit [Candidatus Limnocylindrales bacterium]|nr:proton-conducting transporter membrane subunit [Candidatus Limnocylindrales bacterium]
MTWTFWTPVALLGVSVVTALVIFPLDEEQVRLRTLFNLGGATLKLLLVGVIFWGSFRGFSFETRFAFLPEVDLLLRVDYLSLLFVTLSAILWFLTTVFAIGYLERSPNRSRFFGFFSLCVTATMGIALAGNMVTFLVFYEMLTVVTYPLVVHRGTGAALEAGRVYLLYTLSGGILLLVGTVWLYSAVGPTEFETGGQLAAAAAADPRTLRWIFLLLVAGLGVKAALFPLHGWLPVAMVAPAPVSALLHAVAVVKAGAFGIVRVVSDVYGIQTVDRLGLLTPLAVLAAFSIIYGSLRALAQDDLKRLLAFSTVSQLAYITLGVAIMSPLATAGGLVHLLHQGMMKVTLFFCAGLLAETLGIHKVSEMNGVGRRMPLTMAAFTVAAFGMIGVPPVAGFVTKWYLGMGAVQAGQGWVLGVLATSSVLNAMYFLPIVGAAWFRAAEADWGERGPAEAPLSLLVPALATGALALAAGVLAGLPFSPLWLVRLALGEVDAS